MIIYIYFVDNMLKQIDIVYPAAQAYTMRIHPAYSGRVSRYMRIQGPILRILLRIGESPAQSLRFKVRIGLRFKPRVSAILEPNKLIPFGNSFAACDTKELGVTSKRFTQFGCVPI